MRELPWRQSTDPYHIWLSEIILQQTRVNQGLGYYLDFLESFPDVHALASAPEDEVMKHWQGLGYYSRARNLHHAAKTVHASGGQFPADYHGLLKLKGVGKYTAAAIASICYGEARAVVDGNVSRVLARIFGVEEEVNAGAGIRAVEALAGRLLEEAVEAGTNPGVHNQAVMEFGALQCVPRNPDCSGCPLQDQCHARLTDQVHAFPRKLKKKAPEVRHLYFFVLQCGDEFILEKRGALDIWPSLYQFPLIYGKEPASGPGDPSHANAEPRPGSKTASLTLANEDDPAGGYSPARLTEEFVREFLPGMVDVPGQVSVSPTLVHQLTHRTLRARFIHLKLDQWPRELPPGWIRVPGHRLQEYPVPRLLERYMDSSNFSYL